MFKDIDKMKLYDGMSVYEVKIFRWALDRYIHRKDRPGSLLYMGRFSVWMLERGMKMDPMISIKALHNMLCYKMIEPSPSRYYNKYVIQGNMYRITSSWVVKKVNRDKFIEETDARDDWKVI